MAKYQEEEMEQMQKVLKPYGTSDRIPNLPSDTALESNKVRQDKAMRNALEKIGMAISPGAAAGIATAEALRNRKKRLTEGESTSDGMKKGGKVSSASKRADGIAQRGKTRGRFV
jgi:hypothetical protein